MTYDLKSIKSLVANVNHNQRTDSSRSAAKLFLQRTLRVLSLASIPHPLQEVDSMKVAKGISRKKQVSATSSQRKADVFVCGQRVVLQNNISGLWNIYSMIVSRRTH